MVAAGEGCTLVPALAVAPRDAVVYSPLPSPTYSRTIGLAWRRSDPRGAEFSTLADNLKWISRSLAGTVLKTAGQSPEQRRSAAWTRAPRRSRLRSASARGQPSDPHSGRVPGWDTSSEVAGGSGGKSRVRASKLRPGATNRQRARPTAARS